MLLIRYVADTYRVPEDCMSLANIDSKGPIDKTFTVGVVPNPWESGGLTHPFAHGVLYSHIELY